MKKIKLMCATLTAILTFGNYTGGAVCAASDDTQTKKNQTAETRTEETQTKETQTKETQIDEAMTEESQPGTALSDEELAAYYGDSVFVGDSIMVGFRNYSAKQTSYVHDIQFLAVGSYSAFNAVKPVTDSNVHPVYKGKKCQIWNAIPLIGSKRAFILLGMNDISILGLEGARDQYKALIDKILETSPDIEIHIISVTYTLEGQGKGKLNNDNLAQYNILLQEMAEENGWGYIDLCTPISDGNGNLAEEYCSDGFVHLSNSAYSVWEARLTDYANAQADLEKTEADTEPTADADTETNTETNTEVPEADTKKDTKSKIETLLESNTSQTTKGREQS